MVLHNFTRSPKASQKTGATKRSTQWDKQVDTGNHLQKAKEQAKAKAKKAEKVQPQVVGYAKAPTMRRIVRKPNPKAKGKPRPPTG